MEAKSDDHRTPLSAPLRSFGGRNQEEGANPWPSAPHHQSSFLFAVQQAFHLPGNFHQKEEGWRVGVGRDVRGGSVMHCMVDRGQCCCWRRHTPHAREMIHGQGVLRAPMREQTANYSPLCAFPLSFSPSFSVFLPLSLSLALCHS